MREEAEPAGSQGEDRMAEALSLSVRRYAQHKRGVHAPRAHFSCGHDPFISDRFSREKISMENAALLNGDVDEHELGHVPHRHHQRSLISLITKRKKGHAMQNRTSRALSPEYPSFFVYSNRDHSRLVRVGSTGAIGRGACDLQIMHRIRRVSLDVRES